MSSNPSPSHSPTFPPRPSPASPSSYFSYPVSRVFGLKSRNRTAPSSPTMSSSASSYTDLDGVFHPPPRTHSPFAPPPLTPLTLAGVRSSTAVSAQVLTRTIAEEIRLLLPPRLQLATKWELTFSVEQDGVSLGTLYGKCEDLGGTRNGYVLVVKDGLGSIFGAFLTDPPHPSPHYFGTGECFLWRASLLPTSSILANLPPPPSADTTNMQRSTTVATTWAMAPTSTPIPDLLTPDFGMGGKSNNHNGDAGGGSASGATTPDRIRFKAFPYSGVNDYMVFCEADYLSVGGGDGKYGLWLDSSLERGVSSPSLTFGNEALSEEGEKFEIMGVEVWAVTS